MQFNFDVVFKKSLVGRKDFFFLCTVFSGAYADVGHKPNCSFLDKIQKKSLDWPIWGIGRISIEDYYRESMTAD